jgi:hypothetical protein
MPTAATPRASVKRSSSCFVSNRMDPSILVGWRLNQAVRNAVTAITLMAIGLAGDAATHDELNPTMVAVFVNGTVL